MRALHIDLETFSRIDLKKAGLDNYAKDPSTGVHCMPTPSTTNLPK